MANNPGHRVATFFYGSYMNPAVLAEVEIRLERWEVARLAGFELVIQPRANLVRSESGMSYGIVTHLRHDELDRLYAHAKDVLGERYLPEAVLVETNEARWAPALCYLCHDMQPRAAEREYVERIAGPARDFGFPG